MDAIDWLESYFNTKQIGEEVLEMPESIENSQMLANLFEFYLEYSTEWLKTQTNSSLELIDAASFDTIFKFAQTFVINLEYVQDPTLKIFGNDKIYTRKLVLEINSRLYYQLCVRLKSAMVECFQINFSYLINNDQEAIEELVKITWIFNQLEPFRLRKIVQEPIIDLIQSEMEAMVISKCQNDFEEPMVQFHLDFLETRLAGLISAVFGLGSSLAFSWMENIFEIIRDYPDTQAALNDLKLCLEHSGEINEFLSNINSAMKQRLLIVDAKTTSILDMFLACKKCIEFLELDSDPKKLILEPIKCCLTARKDVARIILSKILESSDPNSEESLEENDIEAILDIFPNRTAFVKEFQAMLSEELTQLTNFDVDDQMRNVEILKSRFGDSEMAKAHVMMKDVADSRRISSHHSTQNQEHSHFSSLIISDLFWPKVEGKGAITPPPIVTEWMKTYDKSFQDLKASRRLKWISDVGVVDIEVKRRNDTLRLLVSPVEASILYLFSELDETLVSDVTLKVGCSIEQVRNSVKFWKSHSLLDIFGDYIVSLEHISKYRIDELIGLQPGGGTITLVEESQVADEKIAEIWPMIEGMLTNLGPSDAGTIHRTLSMFMSDFSYDLQQFQKLLDQMAVQDKLEVDGHIFKIKKS